MGVYLYNATFSLHYDAISDLARSAGKMEGAMHVVWLVKKIHRS
jgi:hypothetical protein